jgi:predicted RNA-binding protein with PIN domain
MPYLIDGNNLLGTVKSLDLNAPGARESLTTLLSRYRSAKGNAITVVYDGPPPAGMRDDIHMGKLRVIYAGPKSDADSVIKRIVREAKNPKSYIVVSTDKQVFSYCKWAGAEAIKCDIFFNDMQKVFAQLPDSKSAPKNKLSENEVDDWLDYFGMEEEE